MEDDDGRNLPPGEKGEVLLRAPNMMKCYLNRPEDTAAAIRDGWLYTGDIGKMDADGFLYILDRKKDMIIIPKTVLFTDAIPRTPKGKILKTELRNNSIEVRAGTRKQQKI